MSAKVVFLDRDGTIIVEPPDKQIDTLEKLELLPGVIGGLRSLVDLGYSLVMVTNQDHLGSAGYPQAAFNLVQEKLLRLLANEGIRFDHVFICPHGPNDNCDCRKPKTGLLKEYLAETTPDRTRSWVVGDRASDEELARNIGCRSVLVVPEKEPADDGTVATFPDACRRIIREDRRAVIRRKTFETDIVAEVILDGSGRAEVSSGIGFFDHMIMQLAKHSGIDLTLSVKGDLHVDEHHSVEDAGLAIGEAIREALGDKRGIARYGAAIPMDESLAQVVLDIGGRPVCRLKAKFSRERVGELPTELVEDFLRAFADGLRANLHVSVDGRNDHHKIEAIFKGLARALRDAVRRDGVPGQLPTTKGML